MLPNRFRRYGNVLIIAAVLALLIVILLAIFEEFIQIDSMSYVASAMYTMFYLGLFINVLTEEMDEDEMIASIRGKAVSRTALIAFMIVILVNLVMGVDHGLGLLPTMPLAIIFMFTTNVLVYIMIYLIIFRISIWKMRRQCKEDQA